MSRIKGKDTLLELKVRKYLFRYRKIVKDLPGTPDIVLDRYRVGAFGIAFWECEIKGCFDWRMEEFIKEIKE